MKKYLSVLPALLLSSLLLGCSINLIVYAGLGSDSITVFEEGLHISLRISLGMASLVYSCGILIIDFFIARKYIGWTSVALSVLCSPMVDLFDFFFGSCFSNVESLILRFVLLMVSLLLTALSCAILIKYENGMNALDAFVYGICEKIHWSYRVMRTLTDALLFLAGWLLGGTFGIGSIIAVVITGTLIDGLAKILKNIG